MVADKLMSTIFAKIILLAVRFFTVFLYLCTLAFGAIERYLYLHITKVILFTLIAIFLYQHTF